MYTLQDLNPIYDLDENTLKIEDKLQSDETIAIKEEPGLDFSSHEMTIEDPKIKRRKQKHVGRKTNFQRKQHESMVHGNGTNHLLWCQTYIGVSTVPRSCNLLRFFEQLIAGFEQRPDGMTDTCRKLESTFH